MKTSAITSNMTIKNIEPAKPFDRFNLLLAELFLSYLKLIKTSSIKVDITKYSKHRIRKSTGKPSYISPTLPTKELTWKDTIFSRALAWYIPTPDTFFWWHSHFSFVFLFSLCSFGFTRLLYVVLKINNSFDKN